MNDSAWHSIGRADELRFDPGASVRVGRRELAVFRLDGGFVAIDNSCPHAGGALADGIHEGATVTCLWHGWSFDLRTGACATEPDDCVRSYEVRERDGCLEVRLDASA